MANDTCANPTVLGVDAGSPFTGDTRNAKTNFVIDPQGTCAMNGALGSIANDEVFSFTAPSAGDYAFELQPNANVMMTLVALDSCATGMISQCIGGAASASPADPPTLRMTMTGAQTIFLVAGASSCSDTGAFTLFATAMPTPPNNWTCDPLTYGDGICDCGCGAVDDDCGTAMEVACDRCTPCNPTDPTNCANSVEPTDNPVCIP